MKELYIAPAIEVTRFAPAQSIANEPNITLEGDIYGSVTEEGGGDDF